MRLLVKNKYEIDNRHWSINETAMNRRFSYEQRGMDWRVFLNGDYLNWRTMDAKQLAVFGIESTDHAPVPLKNSNGISNLHYMKKLHQKRTLCERPSLEQVEDIQRGHVFS